MRMRFARLIFIATIKYFNNEIFLVHLPGPGLVSTSPESKSNMSMMVTLLHKMVVVLHSEPSADDEMTVYISTQALAVNLMIHTLSKLSLLYIKNLVYLFYMNQILL